MRGVALLAILWFAGLTWWLAIPGAPGYSFDDREAIVGNPVVEGTLPAAAAFDRDYWHHLADAGHYRPLATLLLRFDAARVDVRRDAAPRTFRYTNLALHLLVILTLGLALIRIERVGGPAFPWFGLALFAVHPANADAVAWISGRTSLLSGLGAAVGLLLLSGGVSILRFRHGWVFAAGLVGTLLSLLAKEDGVVIAAALPIIAWALPRRGAQDSTRGQRWRRAGFALVGAGLAVLAVGWLRHGALGSAMPAAPSAPLAATPLVERLAIGLSAWWQGVGAALTPWASHPPSLTLGDVLPRSGALPSPMGSLLFGDGVPGPGLAGAVGLALLVFWLLRGRRSAQLSSCLALLAALPLIQLVPAGELFAPRFLYQPLLLGVVGTSALAAALSRPLGPRVSLALQVVLLVGLAWCSIERAAPVYDTRESYWRAHLPAHDGEAKIWNAIGECQRERGDLEAARASFLKSKTLDPRYSRPLANLGALEAREGNLDAAETWLEEAIFEGPDEPAPRANLATILLRQGRANEALEWYRDAARLAPGRATYHRGAARAALSLGDLDSATEAVHRALELSPQDPLTRSLAEEVERARQASPSTGTARDE
ncbi:Tetratricopeptide repeat protein [Planctomycetes bacterium Poly30]|uniref:Tetratricopeptide repeat protein n=2 Tax=Saltatorellus ferox TaxID=2528018 RepID=A0A518ETN3_9BACT|nr:Tetratricopeptide repeat protein [Planctomycetes bacterium Poly30]